MDDVDIIDYINNENNKKLKKFIREKIFSMTDGLLSFPLSLKFLKNIESNNKLIIFLKILYIYFDEYNIFLENDIFHEYDIKFSIIKMRLKKLNFNYSNILLSHIYLKNEQKINKFKYYWLKTINKKYNNLSNEYNKWIFYSHNIQYNILYFKLCLKSKNYYSYLFEKIIYFILKK